MGADWIGKTLKDRYEVVELLGSGGMSSVYKATDPNLDRVVAVKIIHPHLSAMGDFKARFRDEATAVAQLRHPNIVQVFDFEASEDGAFIVFEFVPGETLQDRLERLDQSGRIMPAQEVTKISGQVADALDYAHARGLVHRDVKPANVIVDVHGDAFLADFGIVKIADGIQHTVTGAVVGTARYMSPEQIRGTVVDGRTDIYALGVTMFEMASGRPPYQADSAMTLMMMHVNDPVPDMTAEGIPEPLGTVIGRSLSKDPDDRYQSAAELAAALSVVESTAESEDRASTVAAAVAGGVAATDQGVAAVPVDHGADQGGTEQPASVSAAGAGGGWRRYAVIGGVLALVAVVVGVVLATRGADPAPPTAALTADVTGEPSQEITTSTAVASTVAVAVTEAPAAAILAEQPITTTTTTPPTTTTAAPVLPETVEITYVYIDDGRYIVEYETDGYVEELPGEHVHFYWNTIYEYQAGVGPDQEDWYVWGGPRPFDAYAVADRPAGATEMCAVVANPDHTIKLGTGNCMTLP